MTNPPPPGYGYGPPPPWPAQYPPVPVSPAGQPLATFGDRLLARLIDGAIITAASLILIAPVVIGFILIVSGLDTDANGEISDEDTGVFVGSLLGLYALIFLIVIVVQYIYEVEMMYRSGQTIGKRIMKIRVVPFQPGAPLTRGIAAKRFLVQFLAGTCIPLLNLLDGLWQLWDKPYQQTLHDKFAYTVVIKVPA